MTTRVWGWCSGARTNNIVAPPDQVVLIVLDEHKLIIAPGRPHESGVEFRARVAQWLPGQAPEGASPEAIVSPDRLRLMKQSMDGIEFIPSTSLSLVVGPFEDTPLVRLSGRGIYWEGFIRPDPLLAESGRIKFRLRAKPWA